LHLKLFGAGGPTEAFKRDFGILAGMDSQELDALVAWFEGVSNTVDLFAPPDSELVSLSARFRLEPEEVGRVIELVRFVLHNWKELDLSLEEIEADLSSLGYSESASARFTQFLGRLQGTRDRVYLAGLRRVYEASGLPTIDDVSLLWDIRPVFSEFSYSFEPKREALVQLLDYTYLLIMEVQASRLDGKSETMSYQLSEEEFLRLLAALERASEQLQALKALRPPLN